MKPLIQAPDLSEIKWVGVSEHTTTRGRLKAILTGIPGPRFWYSWKHHAEFKAQLRDAQIALHRIDKGQWEVVVWINHRNAHLVEQLGFAVPVAAPVETADKPF